MSDTSYWTELLRTLDRPSPRRDQVLEPASEDEAVAALAAWLFSGLPPYEEPAK